MAVEKIETLLPIRVLHEYSRRYPGIWQGLERVKNHKGELGTPEFDWPDWCWAPLNIASIIMRERMGVNNGSFTFSLENMGRMCDVDAVNTLSAWRVSQGIYRFESELAQSLIGTTIDRELPSEVFFRLPEWCVYVEIPRDIVLKFDCWDISGFWAILDYNPVNKHSELRLLLVSDHATAAPYPSSEGGYWLLPINLHLAPGLSLVNALKRSFEDIKGSIEDSKNAKGSTEFSDMAAFLVDNSLADEASLSLVAKRAQPFLSLLLYLCANDPDVTGGLPEKATPTKTKKGPRWFPAQKPVVREVGVRVVKWMREARAQAPVASGDGQSGRSVVPHMRKAHWHGYWTGPRKDPEARNFELKWIPPTMVGFKEGETVGAPTVKIVD